MNFANSTVPKVAIEGEDRFAYMLMFAGGNGFPFIAVLDAYLVEAKICNSNVTYRFCCWR